MNILLCESHYRSRSWIEALKNYSHLYLLSVMPEEYELHIKNYFQPNNICNLTPIAIQKYYKGINIKQKIKYLRAFEKTHKINLNYLILMDRTLRKKSYNVTIDYIYKIIKKEICFLKTNNIKLIFMEPTWFHELVLCEIAKAKNIPVFSPVRDKLLTNKFYFFESYNRSNFFLRPYKNRKISNKKNINIFFKKPPFFDYFKNRNKFNLNKLKIFFRILRLSLLNYRNPYIQPTFFWSVKTKFMDIVRKKFFNFFLDFYMPHINDKFILIPLHVQPEAGIDVIGEKFSNQLEFVRQISRTLPAGLMIYVKEHPHDFGRRSFEFYEQLLRIPAVKLINPSISNKNLIKKTKLVISVAGTTSLEAALVRKPAVTAVKSHFDYLMVQPTFDPFTENVQDLLNKCKKFEISKKKINTFFENSRRNLFDGNTIDCKTDPSVLSKSNLLDLENAFLEVIRNWK